MFQRINVWFLFCQQVSSLVEDFLSVAIFAEQRVDDAQLFGSLHYQLKEQSFSNNVKQPNLLVIIVTVAASITEYFSVDIYYCVADCIADNESIPA